MRKGEVVIGVGRFFEAQQRRDENAVSPLDIEPEEHLVLNKKFPEIVDLDVAADLFFHPRFIATESPKVNPKKPQK